MQVMRISVQAKYGLALATGLGTLWWLARNAAAAPSPTPGITIGDVQLNGGCWVVRPDKNGINRYVRVYGTANCGGTFSDL